MLPKPLKLDKKIPLYFFVVSRIDFVMFRDLSRDDKKAIEYFQ